ncbi:MAG: Gfo/Idh/MocA family oxidoreductase [Acidobacteriota bacterium]|nr:Gfo/Idh/MocA family oxidoreductase [Acidobacteriota bacterium]
MGRTHLRALSGSAAVSVTGVAEPVAALRDDAVATFGVTGFASLDEMLSAGGLDGVLVVTPSDTHVEVIAAVAEAGLAILCEKPCGVAAGDTRRAAQIVRDAGVPLQVAYWRRFVPALVELREGIVAGRFGDVLSVSCLQWDGEPPSAAFRARSGGVFIDMGVHEFDQARWLLGSDVARLSAAASPVITDPECRDDPDSAQVLAVMASGATAYVSLGRHYAGGDVASVEVFGTRDHALSVFLDPAEGERAQLDALARQAEAFARFAAGAPCEGATVEDAVAALEAAASAAAQVGP